MDRNSVFRRSPSLPSSPEVQFLRRPSISAPRAISRRSPPRGQSMQTTPSSWKHSTYWRSYSNDLDDLVALSSASSSSSTNTNNNNNNTISTTTTPAITTIPSGDSDEIPRGSMRKRLPSKSNHSGISPHSKKSLSFRRKKKRRQFLSIWRTRNTWKRIGVIIFMLFVISFSMAYLSARNTKDRPRPKPSSFSVLSDLHNSVSSILIHGSWRTSFASNFSPSWNPFSSLSKSVAIVNTNIANRSGLRGSISKPAQPVSFRRNTPNAPLCSMRLTPDDVDFTVVTQLSLNRLWMMEHHCDRWKGYFSIAVYANDGSAATKASVQAELVQMGCPMERVDTHLITGYSEEEYPVNILRNAALSSVTTSHVIYVDIDFWEATDLRETLQNHLDRLANDPKAALVIPAFQLNRQCKEWRECPELNVPMMPRTKDELLTLMIDKRQGNAFDPTNLGGHGSTRYRDWFDQDADQLVPIECVNSNRYEPYLIFRYCDDLPPFQEAFTGYGKNKMTWVMQLRREGYRLLQLGQSFVVHYPHLDSKARMYWNGGKNGKQLRKPSKKDSYLDFKRGQIDETFLDFRTWLEANIPDQTVVQKCHDALNDDEKLWAQHH